MFLHNWNSLAYSKRVWMFNEAISIARAYLTIGNCDTEICQFHVWIQIWKDQNQNFEFKFEICEKN